jgi:phosphoribosylformylglycinamidine synthase
MAPVSLAHHESFEDERLMMEILRGSPALSAFRINKLLARFQAANLPVSTIYAEYVHFADLNAPLSGDDRESLARLLKYGPNLSSHTPTGKLLLVTPVPAPSLPGLLKLPTSPITAACLRWCAGTRRGVLRRSEQPE